MKDLRTFFDNGLNMAVSALDYDPKAIIMNYGSAVSCNIDSFYDANIKDGRLYNTTELFCDENLLGVVKEIRGLFEEVRSDIFGCWFRDYVDTFDTDDLIDVSNFLILDKNTNIFKLNGCSSEFFDTPIAAAGTAYFDFILNLMSVHCKAQSIPVAAMMCGAKYKQIHEDKEDGSYSSYWTDKAIKVHNITRNNFDKIEHCIAVDTFGNVEMLGKRIETIELSSGDDFQRFISFDNNVTVMVKPRLSPLYLFEILSCDLAGALEIHMKTCISSPGSGVYGEYIERQILEKIAKLKRQ